MWSCNKELVSYCRRQLVILASLFRFKSLHCDLHLTQADWNMVHCYMFGKHVQQIQSMYLLYLEQKALK